jgi:hypothetical protein
MLLHNKIIIHRVSFFLFLRIYQFFIFFNEIIDKTGNYLTLHKGDLVVLQQENTDQYSSGWCFGENDRTGKRGDFPNDFRGECVYLLPTTSGDSGLFLILLFLKLSF